MDRLQAVSVKFTVEEIIVLLNEMGISGHAGLDTMRQASVARN